MKYNPISRRAFLRTAGSLAALTVWEQTFGLSGPMRALAQSTAGVLGNSSLLVVVNLAGGCSYNSCPIYESTYRAKNPDISYGPGESLPLSSGQGLHPALTGLKAVYDEGRLALLNLVGYPNPNRSHDESARIWQSGLRSGSASTFGGWGARTTCQITGNIFAGFTLAGSNTFSTGDCNPPRSIGDLNSFGETDFEGYIKGVNPNGDPVWADGTEWLQRSRRDLLSQSGAPRSGTQKLVRTAISNLDQSLELIRQETNVTLPVNFPNTSFGARCRDAARIMAASELGARIIFLELGGFDTHSEERTRQQQLFTALNGGLTALINTAKTLGRWQDLVIATTSEFCRTFQNGSLGTDHGHAGPMLVLGGRVNGGIKNPPPSADLTSAAQSYYDTFQIDFRQPLKEIIAAMGFDAGAVFPERFSESPLGLIS